MKLSGKSVGDLGLIKVSLKNYENVNIVLSSLLLTVSALLTLLNVIVSAEPRQWELNVCAPDTSRLWAGGRLLFIRIYPTPTSREAFFV